MGIFNSVGQVIKNRKQFKQWEEQEADKQAQREALYEKKQLDEETLKKAAAKGKVIMDVVDIMDTHSEEVAENVEEAVMPLAEVASPLAMIGGIAGASLIGWNKFKELFENIEKFNESELGREYGSLIWKLKNSFNDEKSIGFVDKFKFGLSSELPELFNPDIFKNVENKEEILPIVEQIKELKNNADNKKIFDSISFSKMKFPRFLKASLLAIGGLTVGVFVLSHILGAKLQVRASRIARWQSREDLKDPKYFVQYTPEQVAQAQNNLEANNENKEENKKQVSFKSKLGPMGGGVLGGGLFGKRDEDSIERRNKGFFRPIFGVMRDNKKYKEWSETYNIEDKKVKKDLTQEELIDAQKDKEIIQRVTKKINNNAEEYSEDMEVAAGVIIGGTPFLGLGISSLLNLLINKTGIAKKGEDKAFNKALEGLDEDTINGLKNARANLEKLSESNEKGIAQSVKKMKALNGYLDNIISALVQTKEGAKLNIQNVLSKAFNFLKSTKASRNLLIGVAGTYLTTLAGALIGLKLQKASARAGRYKAKQEIANDPRNFVGYSEQDFKEVENVKAKKKTFGEKIVETVTFIPRVIKDYIDYEKFRKTEAKQDKKLLKELTKLEVSDEQLNEAKDLQRKVFTTFENVDDKSQEYSESIEAVNEMTMPLLPFVGMAAFLAPFGIALAKAYKKGGAGVVEAITGFFAKHTKFLKGKTSKKILGEVKENANKTFSELKIKPLVDVAEASAETVQQTAGKNESAMKKFMESLEQALKEKRGVAFIKSSAEKNKEFESLFDVVLNKVAKSNISEEQLAKIYKNMQIISQNIPAKEVKEIWDCIVSEYKKNPEEVTKAFFDNKLNKIIASKTAINIAAISAGTWTALTFVLTYALETILAGMQKNAGKLGVMTALNEMDDEKYYADENTSFKGNISQKQINNVQVVSNKPQSKMLENMLKK